MSVLLGECLTQPFGRVKFGENCGRQRRLRANFERSLARHC
ncbi:hypothetical protein BN903_34 [Halorubrum sp. AJ67]|nr:hypothetical protein BN903_34 [Halorubrum sp. AJ67]